MRVTTRVRVARTGALTLLAATAAGGLLTGCTPAEAVPATGGARPATELTITMREVDWSDQDSSTFTLTCDPVGGDLPTAIAACANLAADAEAGGDPFASVPAGAVCSAVIEGPGLITVVGTWAGAPVQAQFDQVDSCENERFHRLLATLGAA